MDQSSRASAINRDQFHRDLREWFDEAVDGEEVGGGTGHARAAWVWIKHLGNRYYLNADTTREGVGDYLRLLDEHGSTLLWSVVENERGNKNKAAFGPSRAVVPGFYLYRA